MSIKAVFLPRTDGRPGASFPMHSRAKRGPRTLWGVAGREWRRSGFPDPRPLEAWEVELDEYRHTIYFLKPVRRIISVDGDGDRVAVAYYSYSSGDAMKIWVDGVMYDETAVYLIDKVLPPNFPHRYTMLGETREERVRWGIAVKKTVDNNGVVADRQRFSDRLATAMLPHNCPVLTAIPYAERVLDALGGDNVDEFVHALRALDERVGLDRWGQDTLTRLSSPGPVLREYISSTILSFLRQERKKLEEKWMSKE